IAAICAARRRGTWCVGRTARRLLLDVPAALAQRCRIQLTAWRARRVCGCTRSAPVCWGGYYEQRSLIWRSRWVTNDGIVECREALALPTDVRTAVLLRRIHVIDGHPRMCIAL